MDKKIINFNASLRSKTLPNFQAGDVVKIHLKIKEGEKERIQIFEGLIIAIKGKQSSSYTITVRKVSNGVGIEMIVPVLSHNVEKIEFIKRAKVRRSKLYYVRGLTAKQSRMKYKTTTVEDITPKEETEIKETEKIIPSETQKEETEENKEMAMSEKQNEKAEEVNQIKKNSTKIVEDKAKTAK